MTANSQQMFSLKLMLSVSGYAATTFDSGASLLSVAEALVPTAAREQFAMRPPLDDAPLLHGTHQRRRHERGATRLKRGRPG